MLRTVLLPFSGFAVYSIFSQWRGVFASEIFLGEYLVDLNGSPVVWRIEPDGARAAQASSLVNEQRCRALLDRAP